MPAPKVILICALAILTGCGLVCADDAWKPIHVDGRDYVSFANVAQVYQFHRFVQIFQTVSLANEHNSLRARGGTSEFYLNGIRFFSDYPLVTRGSDNLVSVTDVSKIINPLLHPNLINGVKPIATVVLDPGHGGSDSGASGPRGTEKAYALDVALAARDQLTHAGFRVEMTRSTDVAVSLEDRVAFANRFPNAIFISIHFNSAPAGSGVETYALAPANVPSNSSTENHPTVTDTRIYPGNIHDQANIALAAAVHGAVLSRVSVFDRGVRHARFLVLRETRMPAILVEGGFLNDPNEGAKIDSLPYRQKLGQAIAEAVTAYQKATTFHDGTKVAARRDPVLHSLGTRPWTESLVNPAPLIQASN